MKYVLVGGIGYLGVNLAEELIRRGYKVIVVGRRGSEAKRRVIAEYIRNLGVDIRLYDRVNYVRLAEQQGDAYIHIAGKITGKLEDFREAHVYLLDEGIRAARELGSRIVYVSSIGAIGEILGVKPGSIVYEEEKHLNDKPHRHNSYHELTKAEGEKLLVSRGVDVKGKWSIIRPGLMMGPWAYHIEWRRFIDLLKLRLAPRIGIGLPIVHVRDVSEVIAEAIEGRYDGLWLNTVSPYYPDMADLVAEGCRQLKRRCLRIPLGLIIKLSLYSLGYITPRVSPLSLTINLLRLRYRYASRHLKREWRPIEVMVKDFLEWVKSIQVKSYS
ncbi:MAG: NAD-dependent epimerase/dehydratase family protein [Acidilobaceae archaeon]